MTLLNTKYPVFEADQVLSQKHLNGLVSYLEEQDRASRIHLLGMGIACGLELSFPEPNSVHISCGTGVTSLGFLIPFEDTNYTHFKETTLSDGFLFPDTEKHEYLEGVLDYVNEYQAFQKTIELLKEDEVATAESNNEIVKKLSDEVLKGNLDVSYSANARIFAKPNEAASQNHNGTNSAGDAGQVLKSNGPNKAPKSYFYQPLPSWRIHFLRRSFKPQPNRN